VHLTFANRAYELARWYREARGDGHTWRAARPVVPDEAAPHADALAIGDGVQVWPQILRDIAVGNPSWNIMATIGDPIATILPRVATCCRVAASSPRRA